MTAAEHRAVILLGVLREQRILFGKKEFVISHSTVAVRILDGLRSQIQQLRDDPVFARLDDARGDGITIRVLIGGEVIEAGITSTRTRRGVRIDLVPVRERVFQLYRRAAEPILPEPRLWGVWSPRQIVDHVRSKRPSPALAELTSFVEEIYFSARLAAETVLPEASEQVDRAIRERARTAS